MRREKFLRVTVRRACESRGVTKAYRLQRLAGLAPSVAARVWEGDLQRIDLKVLGKIITALGCNLTDIIEVTEEQPIQDPIPLIENPDLMGDIEPEVLPEPAFTSEPIDRAIYVILEEDEEPEDEEGLPDIQEK